MELELELELKITELELELNWKNGIDPNPDYIVTRPSPHFAKPYLNELDNFLKFTGK